MAIFHLFINGKYRFKTNSFQEVFENIADTFDVHEDIIISALIVDNEFHLYDFDGNRKVDIVVSTYGK